MVIATRSFAVIFWEASTKIWRFLACWQMRLAYVLIPFLAAVASGIMRKNLLTIAGFAVSILILFGQMFWDNKLYFRRHYIHHRLLGQEKKEARQLAKRGYDRLAYAGLPSQHTILSDFLFIFLSFGIIPLLFSSSISTWHPISARAAKYAVVGDRISPIDKWILTYPLERVVWIQSDQLTWHALLQYKLDDSATVAVEVEANLNLRGEKTAILQYAANRESIRATFESRLQEAFQNIIEERGLQGLGGEILLTCLLFEKSGSALKGLPLVWNGEFTTRNFRIIRR